MRDNKENNKRQVKKLETWNQALERLLTKQNQNGISYKDAILRRAVKLAESGDKQMIMFIWEQVNGKAISRQQTDITSQGQSLNATVNFVDSSKTLNMPSNNIPLNDNPSQENIESEGAQPLEKNEECKRDTD